MADDDIIFLGGPKNPFRDPSSHQPASSPKSSDDVLFVLKSALNRNASDVHFQVGGPPLFRIDGLLLPFTDIGPVTTAFMVCCMERFLNEGQKKILFEERQLDCSVTLPNFTHRFRINFFFQRNHLSAAFRLNPVIPPTMQELGLPPIMEQLASLPHGLVLITGATGCGKTTTLAAVVDYMNHHRNGHIITISDPIEYVHKNKKCLISQREIGNDATSFANALRVALREDPNVLVIEELRDLESVSIALTAAETGHLVFATLHTNDVVQAIDRIIDVFPSHQQHQVRIQMALTLQAVISQVLVKKKGTAGRVAVFETMPVTTPIRHLIRDDQAMLIYNVISMNRNQGMILRNDALKECIQRNLISPEDAEPFFLDTSLFQTHKNDHRRL